MRLRRLSSPEDFHSRSYLRRSHEAPPAPPKKCNEWEHGNAQRGVWLLQASHGAQPASASSRRWKGSDLEHVLPLWHQLRWKKLLCGSVPSLSLDATFHPPAFMRLARRTTLFRFFPAQSRRVCGGWGCSCWCTVTASVSRFLHSAGLFFFFFLTAAWFCPFDSVALFTTD